MASAPAAPGLVTIKVMVYDLVNAAVLDPVIAAFQDQHENFRVEKVPLTLPTTGEQSLKNTDQVREMVKNGDLDLVFGDGTLYTLINEGLIADLQPLIQQSRFNTDAFRSLYDERLLVNGRLYELPYQAHPMAIVYNKDVVAAAGISIPADKWTWEQFRETARFLAHGQGQDRFWGIAPMQSEPLVKTMVAGAMQQPPGLPIDEAVARALDFFGGMVHSDRSTPQLPPLSTPGKVSMEFFQGKAAMSFADLLSVLQFQAALPIAVAPMPSFPGGKPVWFAVIDGYGIAENSAHKDAAWAFLSFLSGPEGALALAQSGILPVYPSQEARQVWLDQVKLPASAAVIADVSWTTTPSAFSEKETRGLIWFASRKALSGEMTPEAAAAEFTRKNNLLKQGK